MVTFTGLQQFSVADSRATIAGRQHLSRVTNGHLAWQKYFQNSHDSTLDLITNIQWHKKHSPLIQ
jgi:hypothetical protein